MCAHRQVALFADNTSHTRATHIDSDALLLLARPSRLRIHFDHGQRNHICTFFRILFCQFNLLLLLPCKSVSFESSCLRKLLTSLQPDCLSGSCILCEMLCFQKQLCSLLQQLLPLSLSNLRFFCSVSQLSASARPAESSSPLSLAPWALLSLFILFVSVVKTPGIGLLSTADLLGCVT